MRLYAPIDSYYGDYEEDNRGLFCLELFIEKYGRFKTIYTKEGIKSELEDYVKENEEYLNKNDISSIIICKKVRRLIRPTKLEIVLKKASRISISRDNFNLYNNKDWKKDFLWFEEKTLALKKAFCPFISAK